MVDLGLHLAGRNPAPRLPLGVAIETPTSLSEHKRARTCTLNAGLARSSCEIGMPNWAFPQWRSGQGLLV